MGSGQRGWNRGCSTPCGAWDALGKALVQLYVYVTDGHRGRTRGRLVQKDNAGVGEQFGTDGQTLALTARKT